MSSPTGMLTEFIAKIAMYTIAGTVIITTTPALESSLTRFGSRMVASFQWQQRPGTATHYY
jgi:hypothetical protein